MLERVFREPKFHVRCLGPLILTEIGNGTDLTPAGRKTRALLGYLCLVGMPVARERLASLLWGDPGDEQARASLRQAIYECARRLWRSPLETGTQDGGGRRRCRDRCRLHSRDHTTRGSGATSSRSCQNGAASPRRFADRSTRHSTVAESERLRVQETLIRAAMAAVNAGMARGETEAAHKIIDLLQQRDRQTNLYSASTST